MYQISTHRAVQRHSESHIARSALVHLTEEAALRDVVTQIDASYKILKKMIVYADNANFICRYPVIVDKI
ncbi:hypothetical protein BBO99_00008936 [Phytophthora kernoviae]|uniref:Uncharacterized protein n=1 Tax=Phytophthora kernoviae TaxID=325452 RepID=A0A3R7HRS4_9STRA|nr:hypothetical protein JM18_009836 [Phytophthora kernoviae]KAG2507306.1 hypothetical protein JM16_008748 [Phytophthora kernoviae]RLN02913.1 hypothetical protein BBI17_009024 [Phytophthora kernoviae]RLN74433.1 hypothetical protein BBO99_00008936 [Phytophthora kernoviae]